MPAMHTYGIYDEAALLLLRLLNIKTTHNFHELEVLSYGLTIDDESVLQHLKQQ